MNNSESVGIHSLMMHRFQHLFPNINVAAPKTKSSVFQSLDKLVKNLPIPTNHETNLTLSTMKNIVDGQQLRIQLNMMENEEQQINEYSSICRKPSNKTHEPEWDNNLIDQASQWAWDHDGIRSEHIGNEFYSFID